MCNGMVICIWSSYGHYCWAPKFLQNKLFFKCCISTTAGLIHSISNSLEMSWPINVQLHAHWAHRAPKFLQTLQLHNHWTDSLHHVSYMELSWPVDVQRHGHWPSIPIRHPNSCGCCNSTTAGLIHRISNWPISFWWFAITNQKYKEMIRKVCTCLIVLIWIQYSTLCLHFTFDSLWPSHSV